MASSVLLATLSILPYDSRAGLPGAQDDAVGEQEKERMWVVQRGCSS